MYYCRVERDSVSPCGDRLTSFVITFPRVVLAETVTHRANYDTWGEAVSLCERTTDRGVSKSSASSRAIPFERMRDGILKDPYMPQWTLNRKGMQGDVATDEATIRYANIRWLDALAYSANVASDLAASGIHKQDCNRLLEPWAWVTQIVTSSRWDNFFGLRCHQAAHPAFRTIARMMFLTRRKSAPRPLTYGQWHLPFVPVEQQDGFFWEPTLPFTGSADQSFKVPLPDLVKHSAARCGWVSYENHDKDGTPEAMLRTFDRFVAEAPIHAGPVEHQATPMHPGDMGRRPFASNLTGWLQARKLLPHEEIKKFNPSEEEIASWGIEV